LAQVFFIALDHRSVDQGDAELQAAADVQQELVQVYSQGMQSAA
jgi:hypothetical protein